MVMLNFQIGVFLLMLYVTSCIGKFAINIADFHCKANDKLCQNNICQVRTVRKGLQTVDFHCYIPEPINKFDVDVKLFKKEPNGAYKEFVLQTSEDFCEILTSTVSSPFFGRIMGSLRKYGLKLTKCPVQGNVTIVNCPLLPSIFPPVMPSGSYRIESNVSRGIIDEYVLISVFDFALQF